MVKGKNCQEKQVNRTSLLFFFIFVARGNSQKSNLRGQARWGCRCAATDVRVPRGWHYTEWQTEIICSIPSNYLFGGAGAVNHSAAWGVLPLSKPPPPTTPPPPQRTHRLAADSHFILCLLASGDARWPALQNSLGNECSDSDWEVVLMRCSLPQKVD